MNIAISSDAVCSIYCEDDPVYRFAANELYKYIRLISKAKLTIKTVSGSLSEPSIYIGSIKWCKAQSGVTIYTEDLEYDGYVIYSSDDSIVLTGCKKRSALYAVYKLLEFLGCCWAFPQAGGEYIPVSYDLSVTDFLLKESPDFELRTIMYGGDQFPEDKFYEETENFIDWMAKNRLNSFFLHTSLGFERDPVYERVRKACDIRDMYIEIGGHGFQNMVLDRNRYEADEHLFREKNGKRQKDGNFCVSADDVYDRALAAVIYLTSIYEGVSVIHLYYDDVESGSWCDCTGCRDIPPVMQAFGIHSYVAEKLADMDLKVRLSFPLYHDTLDVSQLSSLPPDNLLGFFAPRERCYSHEINSEICERNHSYSLNLLNNHRFWENNIYIMEYYMDVILYSNMKTVLQYVICKDLKAYHASGARKIAALDFGIYSRTAYNVNHAVFALCAWDTDTDAAEHMEKSIEMLCPIQTEQVIKYFKDMEEISSSFLSFCGYVLPFDIRDCFTATGHGDFYRNQTSVIKECIKRLEMIHGTLNEIIAVSAGRQAFILISEREAVKLTIKELTAIHARQTAAISKELENDTVICNSSVYKAIVIKLSEAEMLSNMPYEFKGVSGYGADSVMYQHNCIDQRSWLNKYLTEENCFRKEIKDVK